MKLRAMIFLLLLIVSQSFSRDFKTKVDALVSPKREVTVITVGGNNADIRDFTSRSIQIAIDAVRANGGGVVKLEPGKFEISAPVRLYDNISLVGSGRKTILHKIDGVRSKFIVDADFAELKVTVQNPSGFCPGMGVFIYDTRAKDCWEYTTAVITAISDNVLYIDNYLVRDYRADRDGIITNACSIIAAMEAENVHISNLTVDGNKENNDYINGCRGGGIYFFKTRNATVENVVVKDFNGDGISWQVTEDITVRNNEIYGCTNFGMHPGTGSPNSLIEGNNSHDNGSDGLFICWRVQHGLVKNNQFHHNGRFGICTGHKDTDMRFEENHIYENASDGINFRRERAANAPHRSIFIRNVVENNGTKEGGYGFSFNSPAKDVVLKDNIIRDTKNGSQKVGIYYYKNSLPVKLENNVIEGHPKGKVK